MPGIRIHDVIDDQLTFDLIDLLDALGKPAELSTWKCNVGECIPDDDAPNDLENAYNAKGGITGAEIIGLASETVQVVDGLFEAFRPGEKRPWITLEAIDSTYWEVIAVAAEDLSSLRVRFSEVEDIEEEGE